MPMKFKQIQAFITVAREGNMTLAAEKMGITQSGLSRLLLSLEADLSASLFERHKHGMALSEYGSAFLPYALTMLNTEQKAREEIELIRGAGKGILRIGCVSSLLTSHFIDKLAAFHQRHPQIHLRIVDRIDSELYKLLLMHDIDIALCGPLPHDEKIVVRGKINWQDRICIVARQHHPLHQAADVTLEAMLDYPWIMPPPSSTPMNILADIFRARQLPCPQPVFECASSSAIKAFLCESDLLTSMPAPVYRHEEALGLLRPFELEGSVFIRDFYAYSHFGVLSGAALQLIQHLKQ
ncbi:TPA: LysR family transcriptional regulator [Klebsiella pneumoniae]|nr:LysR family transcriptional regulator [Klebsiella pneumoniae]HBS5957749.1 LysR family transcriptional regulator [Klebsiella pneumoniae]